MSRPKIMIVEDEFLIRLTLAEALADEGFDVIEAATADEALIQLRDNPDVALLLTDIQLPGHLDGIELVREARQQAPGMPVIFMTGRPDNFSRNETSPADVYIAKPYLPSDVCAIVHRLIAAR